MNTLLSIGTKIVILALIAYSVAIITEQRRHRITNIVLGFMTAGIILDIAATTFMILGSSNSPFTPHGILGYSSLLAMLIDATLFWQYRLSRGSSVDVTRGLHFYSRLAYMWWILAFITGSVLVLSK